MEMPALILRKTSQRFAALVTTYAVIASLAPTGMIGGTSGTALSRRRADAGRLGNRAGSRRSPRRRRTRGGGAARWCRRSPRRGGSRTRRGRSRAPDRRSRSAWRSRSARRLGATGPLPLGARRRDRGGCCDRPRGGSNRGCLGRARAGSRPVLVLHRSVPHPRVLGLLPVGHFRCALTQTSFHERFRYLRLDRRPS